MGKAAFGSYNLENEARVIATYFDKIDLDRLETVLSQQSARTWNVRVSDDNVTFSTFQ